MLVNNVDILIRFNKIAIQGKISRLQVDKEATGLSRATIIHLYV